MYDGLGFSKTGTSRGGMCAFALLAHAGSTQDHRWPLKGIECRVGTSCARCEESLTQVVQVRDAHLRKQVARLQLLQVGISLHRCLER